MYNNMTQRQELSSKNLENLNGEFDGIELLFNKKKSIASSDIGSVKALSMKEEYISEYDSEIQKPEIIECEGEDNYINEEYEDEDENEEQIQYNNNEQQEENISVIDSEPILHRHSHHKQKQTNETEFR